MTKQEIDKKVMPNSISIDYKVSQITNKVKLGKKGKKYIKQLRYDAKMKDLDIIHKEIAPKIKKMREIDKILQQSAQKRYIRFK